jgi:hypothetical protein
VLKEFVFLNTYVSVMGGNPESRAQQIVDKFEVWAVKAAAVYSQRQLAYRNINAAETPDEVLLARDAAVAALDAI